MTLNNSRHGHACLESQYLKWGWQKDYEFNPSLSYKTSPNLPPLSEKIEYILKYFIKITFSEVNINNVD